MSGNVLQPDSLARLGEDSFIPNLQQLNLGLESVSSLSSDLVEAIPSVQEISDAVVVALSFPFSASDSSAVDDSERGDDSEETKEVEDHEKIIKTEGSHLNTEETVTTETLQESSTNSLKEEEEEVDKVNKV